MNDPPGLEPISEGNDDALLRWNTCTRLLARNEHLHPHVEGPVDPSLE